MVRFYIVLQQSGYGESGIFSSLAAFCLPGCTRQWTVRKIESGSLSHCGFLHSSLPQPHSHHVPTISLEDRILYRQQTLGTSCLPLSHPEHVSCQLSNFDCRVQNGVVTKVGNNGGDRRPRLHKVEERSRLPISSIGRLQHPCSSFVICLQKSGSSNRRQPRYSDP
jgi:hypothetical protein